MKYSKESNVVCVISITLSISLLYQVHLEKNREA